MTTKVALAFVVIVVALVAAAAWQRRKEPSTQEASDPLASQDLGAGGQLIQGPWPEPVAGEGEIDLSYIAPIVEGGPQPGTTANDALADFLAAATPPSSDGNLAVLPTGEIADGEMSVDIKPIPVDEDVLVPTVGQNIAGTQFRGGL